MALLPIFSWIPSYGSAATRKPLIRSVQYGDGYEESAPQGLNNNPRSFNLAFDKRSDAETKAISDFLEATAGVAPFLFIPYAPYNTVGVFVCKTWQSSAVESNSNNIQATFDEKFIGQDVLPTPIPATTPVPLPASSGIHKATSVQQATSWNPTVSPIVNYASYPVGTRFRGTFVNTTGTQASLAILPPLNETTNPGTLFDGSAATTLGANAVVGGTINWTLATIRAFHDYYRPSFSFVAFYPRNTTAYNAIPT